MEKSVLIYPSRNTYIHSSSEVFTQNDRRIIIEEDHSDPEKVYRIRYMFEDDSHSLILDSTGIEDFIKALQFLTNKSYEIN